MKKPILKYFKAFTLVGIMASLIAVTSCGDDDGVDEPVATETVWEIIENTDNLSKFESEVSVFADLETTLSSEGEYTVFAPTDAALENLLSTLTLEDFSTVNADIAKAVLSFHIAAGTFGSGDISTGDVITTLQGEDITVAAGPTLETGATSPSTFVTTDIQATNGVVHLIDVVMIPETIGNSITATLGTTAQPILLGADFTILAGGIAKADAGKDQANQIISILANPQATEETKITVFAPTNATFEAAGVTVDGLDAATWDAYIRNHIVIAQGGSTDDGVSTLGEADFTTGATYNTLGGGSLFFVNNPDAAMNGIGIFIDSNGDFDGQNGLNAEIALLDLPPGYDNGRVHIIAGILAPQ